MEKNCIIINRRGWFCVCPRNLLGIVSINLGFSSCITIVYLAVLLMMLFRKKGMKININLTFDVYTILLTPYKEKWRKTRGEKQRLSIIFLFLLCVFELCLNKVINFLCRSITRLSLFIRFLYFVLVARFLSATIGNEIETLFLVFTLVRKFH